MSDFRFYNTKNAEDGQRHLRTLEVNNLTTITIARQICEARDELVRLGLELATKTIDESEKNAQLSQKLDSVEAQRSTLEGERSGLKKRLGVLKEEIGLWRESVVVAWSAMIGTIIAVPLINESSYEAPLGAPNSVLMIEGAVVLTEAAVSFGVGRKKRTIGRETEKSEARISKVDSELAELDTEVRSVEAQRASGYSVHEVTISERMVALKESIRELREHKEKPDREIGQALKELEELGMRVPKNWRAAGEVTDFLHSEQVESAKESIAQWSRQGSLQVVRPFDGLSAAG